MWDEYIEKAVPARKRNRAWTKWGALAACLCLVIAGGVFFKTVYTDSDSRETLLERLEAYGLPVASVETPTFISAGKNQPMATKEDLMKNVQAGTTVRGQVQNGFYVEVTQGNEHWYVAQIRLKVTEVITGALEDTSVEIVSACVYIGEDLEARDVFLIEDALLPCQEGFEGVFVLRDIDEGHPVEHPWHASRPWLPR